MGRLISTADMATAGAVYSGITAAGGLTVNAAAFDLGGLSYAGGSLTLIPNGTWFVGVDLFSKVLIALPRLGHRGWVPLARVTTGPTVITKIQPIVPELPTTRIPRTIKKILEGKAISVVVMGSSLTQGGNTTDWPGMLFNASSSLLNYRVPGTITAQYRGVGGSPNQYQVAQLGFGSSHSSYGYAAAGFPRTNHPKAPPNGRSAMFSGVDLVVIGCLANGGEYRLENIEILARRLRAQGIEVIFVTDNPQGPSSSYSTMNNSALYVDGPEVMRVADIYGCEVADTAAYVFEGYLRHGTSMYGDTIHMSNGSPAGRTAVPSCGHELWARAVRSIIPIDGQPPAPSTVTFNFNDGTQGWGSYGSATIAQVGGALRITKSGAADNQWGGGVGTLPTINSGDTVRIRGTMNRNGTYSTGNGPQIGLQAGGWASNVVSVTTDGAFDVTITANKTSTYLLFYGQWTAAPDGANFTIDDLVIDITSSTSVIVDLCPGRSPEVRPLPPSRVVSDMKTPGDAFIILPADEYFLTAGNPQRGTLGAHPWGSGSFARCFAPTTGSSSDLLTLTVGKSVITSGQNVIGWSMVRYADQNDAALTIEVYRNDSLIKTINYGTVPFGNEWLSTIIGPTEVGKTTPTDSGDSLRLTVTSGTLKLAALVVLTADQEYLSADEINYVGNWLPREVDSGTGLPGFPTDTALAYATVKCTGRRVQWLTANRPTSQPVNFYSEREQSLNSSQSGTNHCRGVGGLLGPNSTHIIQLTAAASSPSSGNRSLHIYGAIIINDR